MLKFLLIRIFYVQVQGIDIKISVSRIKKQNSNSHLEVCSSLVKLNCLTISSRLPITRYGTTLSTSRNNCCTYTMKSLLQSHHYSVPELRTGSITLTLVITYLLCVRLPNQKCLMFSLVHLCSRKNMTTIDISFKHMQIHSDTMRKCFTKFQDSLIVHWRAKSIHTLQMRNEGQLTSTHFRNFGLVIFPDSHYHIWERYQ